MRSAETDHQVSEVPRLTPRQMVECFTLGAGPPGLSVTLMLEMSPRVDIQTARLIASLEAGYCIDAPDLMPAGACRFWELAEDPSIWLVEQILFERDKQ